MLDGVGRRVLVCGGRDYRDQATVDRVLDGLLPSMKLLIHGAATGADSCAQHWARTRMAEGADILVDLYPPDWKRHGRAAGHIRNAEMLAQGKPDLVVAFPGGRGTENMVTRAIAAGVTVWRIS